MDIDPLARWYRSVEYCAFGRALERRRFAFLHRLKNARRILVLGEGDGRAVSRMLVEAPLALIDVVELSQNMIALAQARVGKSPRVRFIRNDARQVELVPSSYDAVVTCFFLDCFPEPEARALVARLAAALEPGGLWLMSDFVVPPKGWRHWHARLWIGTMYRFFRITTGLRATELPPIERLLGGAGLVRIAREEERAGMVASEVWKKPL